MVQITITCGEYRNGRRLLALTRQLETEKDMDPKRRAEIEAEVAQLEHDLGMD